MTLARRGTRLDRAELAVLAAFAVLGVAPLVGLLIRVWSKGGVISGADGFLVVDSLQYVAWIRQAGEHVLVGNLYDLAPGPRSFLHPGLLLGGVLSRAGLGIAASYLVLTPLAVGAAFAGALALCRRHLEDGRDRLLALILALFACSPVAALVGWGGLGDAKTKFDFDFISGEAWLGAHLWGYLFTAIAVGLMPLCLLAYERGALRWAAAAGLFCAWLQPWQGIVVALTLVVAEAICVRRGRAAADAARKAAPVLVAIALPLVYYLVLSHTDASWELADRANDFPRWPWWVTVTGLLPLVLLALPAYRLAAPDFGSIALRVWPLASLVVFYQPAGTFPFHAFQGLTLPLAVLGAQAWRGRFGTLGAIGLVVLLAGIGTAYRVDELRDAVNVGRQAFFFTDGEHDALRALDHDPEPGGVLTPAYLGTVVPAYTGRETWLGAGSWTPDLQRRQDQAEALFGGRLGAAASERLVRRSRARFLLSDCHGRANIDALVRGFTDPPRAYGCAKVWRVR